MDLTWCRHGAQRRVSVYKTKKKVDTKKEEGNPYLTFSGVAKEVLLDLFTRYPPDDAEMATQMTENGSGTTDKIWGKRDDIFCRPSMNKEEIAKKVDSFASRIEGDPHLKQVLSLYQTDWPHYCILFFLSDCIEHSS